MGVKVSVIIPVFNPGPCLDTCLQSLLGQSLAPGEYEILFVDDASTDGTSERLGTFAEKYSHVRVIHAAGSGGPGRPRNIGIEVASGEYVYFLDPDDRLTPPALERMYAMAARTKADIVLGKQVGHSGEVGRGHGGAEVPASVFWESRDKADPVKDHLFDFVTPHMLYRTGFLLRHRLRFTEGPVWLDDQRFVVEAYFRAKMISVLADEVCCHWVNQRGHTHYPERKFDPVAYLRSMRTVLDAVDASTAPGDERDQIYAYWYDGDLLRLLGGGAFLGRPVRHNRQALHREAQRFARERFSTAVERWLPLSMRVRARLLDVGAFTDIVRLATTEHGLTVLPTLERVDWDGNQLVVRASAQLVYADGRPVTFRREDGRLLWEPPVQLRTKVPIDTFDVTKTIADSRLDLYLRNRDNSGEFRLPTLCHLVPEGTGDTEQVVLQGTAKIDVRTAKLGNPLEAGSWDCFVRVESCGWNVVRRLARPSAFQTAEPAPARTVGSAGGPVVEPYWTSVGNLSVRITDSEPGSTSGSTSDSESGSTAGSEPGAESGSVPGRAILELPIPERPGVTPT